MKEVSNDDFILRLHLTAWETTAVQHSGAAIVNRSAKRPCPEGTRAVAAAKWLARVTLS